MYKDKTLLFLALAQTIIWASLYYLFPALLLHWENAFPWSRSQLTAAITLAVLVSALASPIVGKLIDQGRGPQVMTASAVIGGLCLLVLSRVATLWQFYLVWLTIGAMLAGCLYEPCFALMTRARGADAKRGITLITLVAGFASSISFPLAHALADAWGWAITVRIFALFVLLLGAPLLWLGSSRLEAFAPARRIRQDNSTGRWSFLSEPAFWPLASGFALLALVHGITLHHLLPILHENGVAAALAVLVAALIGPMQVSGRVAMMSLEKKASNHVLTLASFATMAFSILMLMLSAWHSGLVFLFVALFGGAYGMVSILRPVIARDILGEERFGSKSGVLAMIYLLGAAAAPLLGSLIWSLGGYQLVLPGIIVLALCGLALYISSAGRAGPPGR